MDRVADDADLFAPALTADDDVPAGARAWNPWSLVMVAFFGDVLAVGGGVLAGGALLGWNWRWLQRPRAAALTWGLTLLLWPVPVGLFLWLRAAGVLGDDRDSQRLVRWGLRAAVLLLAMGAAAWQRRRFAVVSEAGPGHAPRGALWPGLAAVIVAGGLTVALAVVLAVAFTLVGAGR